MQRPLHNFSKISFTCKLAHVQLDDLPLGIRRKEPLLPQVVEQQALMQERGVTVEAHEHAPGQLASQRLCYRRLMRMFLTTAPFVALAPSASCCHS